MMMNILTYLFYPNPGHLTYGSTQILLLLALCGGLILLSFLIRIWRTRQTNAVTKRLSRSWSSVALWFGISGLVLTVSRVEKIQFIAMRFLWVIWAAVLILAVVLQYRMFRMRHYEVMPRKAAKDDPGAKYLPGKKK